MTRRTNPHVAFDPGADAVYVYLREREPDERPRTRELRDGCNVDYGRRGRVLGVEFLWVSDGINLEGVPRREEILAALKAFPVPSAA